MSTVTRPRGPLPRRIYWTRRLVVVVLALVLVLAVAHLLGGTVAGGPSGSPPASPVAADAATSAASSPSPAATTPGPSAGGVTTTGAAPGTEAVTGKGAAALAVPTGVCADDDVLVAPSVRGPAYAGGAVTLRLLVSTRTSPACTWTVSADSLVVKVTRDEERIWSTQQCREAVPTRSVVLRQALPTAVPVVWSGQRSDADCSRIPGWADVGLYDVMAAPFGGDPLAARLPLVRRPARTVTATPTPTDGPSAGSSGRPSAGSSRGSSSGSSSGAANRPTPGPTPTAGGR